MGTAKYCVNIELPGGKLVDGAQITAQNKDAWFDSARFWQGITKDGIFCWDHLDTGLNGDKYDFSVRYADLNGVEWRAFFSDRIFSNSEQTIVLRQMFLDEEMEFSIPTDIENYISREDGGKEILAAMRELATSIKKGMSHSALALSTYILEGMIMLKAKNEGVWDHEFEGKTFGGLLKLDKVRKLFPNGALDKAEALNKLRIPGVHFKNISSTINEAKIGANLIMELGAVWFRNTLGRDNPTGKINSN
jgi:hypothetical protein